MLPERAQTEGQNKALETEGKWILVIYWQEPILSLAQEHPFCLSDLQNCNIINVCCFEPQRLWELVTAIMGK